MKGSNKSISESLAGRVITNFAATLIPVIASIINCIFWQGKANPWPSMWITAAGALISFLLLVYASSILSRFKFFRPYKKYEGKWLQIIPEFARPFSIIEFEYNKALHEYEMHGINYSYDMSYHVVFDAYRFVERAFSDGFYYITNPTSQYTNGLGKFCFIKNNEDNLVRAEGYFFDSGSAKFSKRYKTYLIKCDEEFFNAIKKGKLYADISTLSAKQIMTDAIDFAKVELEHCSEYREHHNTVSFPLAINRTRKKHHIKTIKVLKKEVTSYES